VIFCELFPRLWNVVILSVPLRERMCVEINKRSCITQGTQKAVTVHVTFSAGLLPHTTLCVSAPPRLGDKNKQPLKNRWPLKGSMQDSQTLTMTIVILLPHGEFVPINPNSRKDAKIAKGAMFFSDVS